MVLVSDNSDSIFNNTSKESILDNAIGQSSSDPGLSKLTRQVNTSLLSIQNDIESSNKTVEADNSDVLDKLDKLSTQLEECCTNMSVRMDNLSNIVEYTQILITSDHNSILNVLSSMSRKIDQILSILSSSSSDDAK